MENLVLKRKSIKNAEVEFKYLFPLSQNTPYQNYQVLRASENLGYRLKAKSNIICWIIYKDDIPVFIAPFREYKDEVILVGTIENYDYSDFIYQEMDIELLQKYVNFLFDELREQGFRKVKIYYLDSASNLYIAMKSRNLIKEETEITNVLISFKDKSFEEYFSGLSKHVRQNCRTAYNRLKKDGHEYGFKISFGNECKEDGNILENIYLRRMKARYKASIPVIIFKKYFNYEVKTRFLDFSFNAVFYIDGKISAFMRGYVDEKKKILYVPRLAIDEEFEYKKYSPGICLINETIKYMINNTEFRVLNLCRGTEKYKYDMGGPELYDYLYGNSTIN